MTNLQKKALKRSHDLINISVSKLFDLERNPSSYSLDSIPSELKKIKWNLVELENWINALLEEK